jgi:quercetin dioxygenase-like cupin family protein
MAEKHSYLKTHRLSGTGLITDALDEAVDLLESARSSASGRAAKTLVKNGPLRLTLVAMRKGAVARPHRVEGPTIIHVLRGRLRVTTPRGPEVLGAGTLYALGAAVEHSHAAVSDCVAVLTIVEQTRKT